MIRYKRLNESVDQSEALTMQLMSTIERSKCGKELKRFTNLKEVEVLVKKALDAVYKGFEEAGVKAVPYPKWGMAEYPYGSFFNCWLSFQSVDKKVIRNIEKNLEELGDQGVFSCGDCYWEISLGNHKKFFLGFSFIYGKRK